MNGGTLDLILTTSEQDLDNVNVNALQIQSDHGLISWYLQLTHQLLERRYWRTQKSENHLAWVLHETEMMQHLLAEGECFLVTVTTRANEPTEETLAQS